MLTQDNVTSHIDNQIYSPIQNIFLSLKEIDYDHSIDRVLLNIENKTRSNLLTWKGQFSPQLIELLIENYVNETDLVFDPFLGSGTLLVEAARKGISAVGTEINPAAYYLASIYTFCNYDIKNRLEILNNIEKKYDLNTLYDSPLFYGNSDSNDISLENILAMMNLEKEKIYLKVLRALVVLLDIYKHQISAQYILITWKKLKRLIEELPYSRAKIEVFNSDARKAPLDKNTIDTVITSPPYINVFNYHQQYRASVELLNEKVLDAAKSEIGSNRKHRSNRFFTVVQYIFDMADVLMNLKRITKENSKIIFVVGRESNVRKTSFYNSEIIASVAKLTGFNITGRQERVFTNRFGRQIYEDLLYFRNVKNNNILNKILLNKLATQVLTNALDRAPEESRKGLLEAIAEIPMIVKSPIYEGVKK